MGKKVRKSVCAFGAEFLITQIQHLKNEIPGVLNGADIEHIHRMRVASRRLRNGLELFKDCLPSKKSKLWKDEVGRITHALGNARDLDIQIDLLNELYNDALDEIFKPGYRRILLRLKQRRSKAQNKVNKAIAGLQEDSLLIKMGNKLVKYTADLENTYLYTPSLYQRAFTAINTSLSEFLSFHEDIQSPENIKKLHAMRIAGKKLRYTLEIFAPIYHHALLPHILAMKDLQDQLGAIHDNDIWVSWLPKFIQKEQTRIDDYFGNTGPLKRLLPGFEHLIEDRKTARADEYETFMSTWKTLQNEQAWEALTEIIKAPLNVEAALEQFTSRNEFNPDNSWAEGEGQALRDVSGLNTTDNTPKESDTDAKPAIDLHDN